MQAKISVIIPAYNAAKTIENTIRNVLSSTIPLEVLVVNDGSQDGTGEILNQIAKDVDNLTVLHQDNTGAYQARLSALKQIKTPYFGFVDADDTIECDMFEKMLTIMERHNLDCVQVGIKGMSRNSGEVRLIAGEELNKHKFGYLVDSKDACYIWDKLYRNKYDFSTFVMTDGITNYDDMVFNFQFFKKINRMGFLDEGLYNYAMTDGSAIHSFGSRQRHDSLWMYKHHLELSIAMMGGIISPVAIRCAHFKWLLRNVKNDLVCFVRSVIR